MKLTLSYRSDMTQHASNEAVENAVEPDREKALIQFD
jgi:hypothetical protein